MHLLHEASMVSHVRPAGWWRASGHLSCAFPFLNLSFLSFCRRRYFRTSSEINWTSFRQGRRPITTLHVGSNVLIVSGPVDVSLSLSPISATSMCHRQQVVTPTSRSATCTAFRQTSPLHNVRRTLLTA